MTKIILLNGPPRVGKDTAAKALLRGRNDGMQLGISYHLKRATHAAYGMFNARHDTFEAFKDQRRPEFLGLTPREAYIRHSEDYIKPLHGKLFFGHMWVRAARQSNALFFAVPDSGFAPEAGPIIDEFGAENIRLIRLHMAGRDFTGDSRSYIELPVPSFDIENVPGFPDAMVDELMAAIR